MRYFSAIFVFILVHVLSAWVSWAGGLNFDSRGNDLQLWAGTSLLFGGYFAVMVFIFYPKKKQ